MTVSIDLTSDIPIYAQIKHAVVGGIASGELQPGQLLPSVRQLASNIGVNMQTVNKAYTLLRQEGYLEINRRVGAVVSRREAPGQELTGRILRDLSHLAAEAASCGMDEDAFIRLCRRAYGAAAGNRNKEDT